MPPLARAALLLNVAVLIPVCAGLVADAAWSIRGYGEFTQARGILLSIYIAIAIVSGLLLILRDVRMVAALLLVQVVYKIITPFTVDTFQNPIVVSNIGIAIFHTVTLVVLWRGMRIEERTS